MSVPAILTINTGSSSVKVSVHSLENGDAAERIAEGAITGLPAAAKPDMLITGKDRSREAAAAIATDGKSPPQMVAALAKWLAGELEPHEIVAVGHRVVHGGRMHDGPCRARADTLRALEKLAPLAPAHQPHNLAGVEAIAALWPDTLQSLSFDTAFHRTQPAIAEEYALPRALTAEGIVRYGFHGLSYQHLSDRLGEVFDGRAHDKVIAAHLGSGASLAALKGGRSIATSMGLTALDGLPMSTRCGDLDPGVVLHLIQGRGMSPAGVSDLLYSQSGLKGVSGISGDVRELLQSEAPEAAEALALYAYRIAREIGSLAAALEGVDALIFTAGVGENAPEIRSGVCSRLRWLGAHLDEAANRENAPLISSPCSRIAVAVVPADEEIIIARETARIYAQA
ncbi:MAG: acetate/propionate family kinase [Alphaproteobacteria bacterium]|jgi:acetate kinase|nr:acetate/propionate family kinase [Alphaproteobacteria bacterium]